MPLTQQQMQSEKEKLIAEFFEFEEFLKGRMNLGVFYSEEEFKSIKIDFVKTKYNFDPESKKADWKLGYGIFGKMGTFDAYLQILGVIEKHSALSGEYISRLEPSKDRRNARLELIKKM